MEQHEGVKDRLIWAYLQASHGWTRERVDQFFRDKSLVVKTFDISTWDEDGEKIKAKFIKEYTEQEVREYMSTEDEVESMMTIHAAERLVVETDK